MIHHDCEGPDLRLSKEKDPRPGRTDDCIDRSVQVSGKSPSWWSDNFRRTRSWSFLLTDAPVVLLWAKETMHEKDGRAITEADFGRAVNLVCEWNAVSCGWCGECSPCQRSKKRRVATHSNDLCQSLFAASVKGALSKGWMFDSVRYATTSSNLPVTRNTVLVCMYRMAWHIPTTGIAFTPSQGDLYYEFWINGKGNGNLSGVSHPVASNPTLFLQGTHPMGLSRFAVVYKELYRVLNFYLKKTCYHLAVLSVWKLWRYIFDVLPYHLSLMKRRDDN